MVVTVRAATPADSGVLATLLTQLGYPSTERDVLGRLDYWIVDPYSQVLVAEQDDRPAGCLSIHALPYLERTGRWARIECMVVDKALRGTGIGNALLQDAEALAESWGCLAVEVTSSRRRTGAHGFYQRNGYTDICDRSGRFWKDLD